MQLIQQQHHLNNSYTAFADNENEIFLEGQFETASRGFFMIKFVFLVSFLLKVSLPHR